MAGTRKGDHVVNTYLPGDLYDKMRNISMDGGMSVSRFLNMLFDDFISSEDNRRDGIENIQFKTKAECSYFRVQKRKSVGIILNDDKYNRLKKICDERNTTVSEVFRVIVKNHIDGLIDSRDARYSLPCTDGNGFQMFIDLG